MRIRAVALLGLSVVLAAACSTTADPDPDLTGVGAHATAASTRIVYAEEAEPLGVSLAAFSEGWRQLATQVEGLAGDLDEASRTEDLVTLVAETPVSGITLDLVAEAGVIQVAQLTLVDGVGDEDEPHIRAAVDGFLALIGAGFDGAGLELSDGQPLFAEREVDASSATMSVYLASNEDSILVGAIGPS